MSESIESENGPDFDTGKLEPSNNTRDDSNDNVHTSNINHNDNNNNSSSCCAGAPNSAVSTSTSSPPVNLAVPPSSTPEHRSSRPHSRSEEQETQEQASTPASNQSQYFSANSRKEHATTTESDSSKPSTPFRLGFPKKAILRTQTYSSGQKRLSSGHNGGSLTGSHFRRKSPSQDGFRSSKDKERDRGRTRDREKEKRASISSSRQSRDGPAAELSHHKSGKAVLNLLNPMSLLARRRSSRVAGMKPVPPNPGDPGAVPAIPEDYDPRIRGNIVHDFSAPRTRRHVSSASTMHQDVANNKPGGNEQDGCEQSPASIKDSEQHEPVNGQRNSRQHVPAFKENFEDDQKPLQVENKSYLNSELLTNPPHPDSERSVPEFARNLPSRVPEEDRNERDLERPVAVLESLPEVEDDPIAAKGQGQGDQTHGGVENSSQRPPPSGLPKHFKSNASRFSFDMNGAGSSMEEKFLEDKHKKKEEAARQAKVQLGEDDVGSEFDGGYDSDLLDDTDGLEEKIPGVNVDADEDDNFGGFSSAGNASSLYATGFSPDISTFINASGGLNLAAAPSIPQGVFPNNASLDPKMVEESPENPSYSPSARSEPNGVSEQRDEQRQLEVKLEPPVESKLDGRHEVVEPGASQRNDDDDDLYFDGGEFDDLTAEGDGERFDESIFDDETSHLFDRNTPAARLAAARLKGGDAAYEEERKKLEEEELNSEGGQQQGLKHAPSMASEYRKTVTSNRGQSTERMPDSEPSYAQGGVLSEHNLEAFHNALERAASGSSMNNVRFDRHMSVDNEGSMDQMDQKSADGTTHTLDSHPGLVSDDSHLSQVADATGVEEAFEEVNYYDDEGDSGSFYDDPIIAAANAEALENDDEGFYGEEFGFYPQAHASANAELTNGGFFGPRGMDGVSRSRSGRAKIQEPSLTPITERSEWSARNSIASLNAFGMTHPHPSTNSPGPGLAQLVDMGHNMDDEMSLSALLRLRREAWGGSDGGLSSGGNSPPPFSPPPAGGGGGGGSSNHFSFPGSSSALRGSPVAQDVSLSVSVTDDGDDERVSRETGSSDLRGTWSKSDDSDYYKGATMITATDEEEDRRSI